MAPKLRPLADTGLAVFPLCLGGNVFGWTADEAQSFAVLDAYLAAGGNFIDTADMYSSWAPGNSGGESETILGRWMQSRSCRDRVVLATKVGKLPTLKGLSAATIRKAADASLARLGTDRIDLYYAHADDPSTPPAETLRAFDELVRAGKVRVLGASNYTAARLGEALEVSRRERLARFSVVQDSYNLVHRGTYEGGVARVSADAKAVPSLLDLCTREHLGFLPYYALAQGFLAGKYRDDNHGAGAGPSSPRMQSALYYLDERGRRVLTVLDRLAVARRTTVAAVALAWLLARPNVVAAIASARNPEQLADLLPMATLELAAGEVELLTAASA